MDYFSLDVEGAELDILHTIPWDKVPWPYHRPHRLRLSTFLLQVDIRVIQAEANSMEGEETRRAMRDFLLEQGYTNPLNTTNDMVFVQEKFRLKQSV